jgi:putative ABC transport system substrate-binding protein
MAFTSCISESGSDNQVTVGIIQMMEHPSLDLIRESFVAEMRALGYTNVVFEHRNGIGADMTALTSIAQIFVGNNVDLILAIATPAAMAAMATTSDIPIVFAAITDPVSAGLVADLNHPDANATGTSDRICVESIFNFAFELVPGIQTVGLVYNLGEANSVSSINDAKAFLTARGINYREATVANTGEVQQAALSLVGHVDAFFTPTDNTVAAAMPIYAQVAINAGLPIFTGADSMVMDGGLATVGIDYAILGAETAEMVSRILAGTPVSQVPVVTMTDFRTIVNRETAEALGISLEGLGSYVEIYP